MSSRYRREWEYQRRHRGDARPPTLEFKPGADGGYTFKGDVFRPDPRGSTVPQMPRKQHFNAPSPYWAGPAHGGWESKDAKRHKLWRDIARFGKGKAPLWKGAQFAFDFANWYWNDNPFGGIPWNIPGSEVPANPDQFTRRDIDGVYELYHDLPAGWPITTVEVIGGRFVLGGETKRWVGATNQWIAGKSHRSPTDRWGNRSTEVNGATLDSLGNPEWFPVGNPASQYRWEPYWNGQTSGPKPAGTVPTFEEINRNTYHWYFHVVINRPANQGLPTHQPTLIPWRVGEPFLIEKGWPATITPAKVSLWPEPAWRPGMPWALMPYNPISEPTPYEPYPQPVPNPDPGVVIVHPPGPPVKPTVPGVPAPGVKERKFTGRNRALLEAFRATQRFFHGVTEYGDMVDAIYEALPDRLQKEGLNPAEKSWEIYKHLDDVNMSEAIKNLLWNQVEDYVIGKGFKSVQDAANRLGVKGAYKLEQPVMDAVDYLMEFSR